MPDAINIEQFLSARGFDLPAASARAREVLEEQGLTHSGKQAFARTKLQSAERAIASALIRVCGDACLRLDRTGAGAAREAVTVSPQGCEICGGSNNRRAAIECVRMLLRRGIQHVVIVGGTDPQQHEVQQLFSGTGLEFRYVEGTKTSHTAKDALANKRWAQLVVIWAPTPLKHAVSNLYTQEPLPGVRVVPVSRRGIEALCVAITKSYT
ncbi:MAG: hypothetical protein M3P30_07810 [Chloroflexota bacterium]|nr:hypothetical protein [Chloroflexota bacterium]